MKSTNFIETTLNTKQKAAAIVEQKKFPGKPLNAGVFKEKFDAANKVGREIKGFKK